MIGGWVLKYFVAFLTGDGSNAAADGYFNGFISGETAPLVFTIIYLALTAYVVFRGVEKGIESFSKIVMPLAAPSDRGHRGILRYHSLYR